MAIRWVWSVIDTAPPDVRPEVFQAIPGAYRPNSNFSRGLHLTAACEDSRPGWLLRDAY